MSDQIANLQEKISFLENALQELSEEHFTQQRELDKLKTQVRMLTDKITNQSLGDELSSEYSSVESEKPPHY